MVCNPFPNSALIIKQLISFLFPVSQIIFLPACPRVLIQTPFNISIFILQRPSSDLKTSHRHSRSDFSQFDTLIPGLHKNMMSYLDAILDILECDNSASKLCFVCDSFTWREDVLQYLDYPQSQFRCEAFEDEMWVGFADSASGTVWDIMAKNNIVEGERHCRTMWEMRKCQSCWNTSMFMEKDYVR